MSARAKTATPPKSRDDIRDRVLRAGFEAFGELGFDGTSTLEIATRAKVSKRELYALFDDKQSIVVECIKWRTSQMQLPFDSLPQPSDARTLSAVLIKFGTALLTGVCDPSVLMVFRFAVAEAHRTPEIAKALNERGREASRRVFIDLVEAAQADGLLLPVPSAEIGDFYFSLLWGDLLLRLLMGLARLPAKADIETRARQAAERLMATYSTAGRLR